MPILLLLLLIGCFIFIVGSLTTGWILELFNITGWVLRLVFVFVIGWLLVLLTLVILLLANGFVYCGFGWRGGNTFVLVLLVVDGLEFILVVLVFAVLVIGLVLIFVLLPIGWSPFNGYTLVYPKLLLTTTSLILSFPLYPNWLLLVLLLKGLSFTSLGLVLVGDIYFLGYYIFFISFFLLSLYSCNNFTHAVDNELFSHMKFHSPI